MAEYCTAIFVTFRVLISDTRQQTYIDVRGYRIDLITSIRKLPVAQVLTPAAQGAMVTSTTPPGSCCIYTAAGVHINCGKSWTTIMTGVSMCAYDNYRGYEYVPAFNSPVSNTIPRPWRVTYNYFVEHPKALLLVVISELKP
jgi:hypothetical protein